MCQTKYIGNLCELLACYIKINKNIEQKWANHISTKIVNIYDICINILLVSSNVIFFSCLCCI